MKKRLLTILLLCSIIFNLSANSFNDAVEDSATEKNDDNSSSSSSSSHTASEGESLLIQIIAQLIGLGWYVNNFTCDYNKYPYCGEDETKLFTRVSYLDEPFLSDLRSHRYSAGSSLFCMKNIGLGSEQELEGVFYHFFGPYVSHQIFCEHYNSFSSEYLANFKLGAQFYILQTNPFSASFVLQWSHWYGNNSPLLDNGIAFGFNLTSYPYKPIVLRYKPIWSEYKNGSAIYESNFECGVLNGPLEYYAGWRHMSVYNSDSGNVYKRWNGISAGVRYYF